MRRLERILAFARRRAGDDPAAMVEALTPRALAPHLYDLTFEQHDSLTAYRKLPAASRLRQATAYVEDRALGDQDALLRAERVRTTGNPDAAAACRVVVHAFGLRGEPLDPRLDLFNHSPSGFEWGYGGSGPAQLALAVLARVTGDPDASVRLHQRFKREVVAAFPPDKWTLSFGWVRSWVEAALRPAPPAAPAPPVPPADPPETGPVERFDVRRGSAGGVALLRLWLRGARHLQLVGETARGFLAWIRGPRAAPLALSGVLDAAQFLDLHVLRGPGDGEVLLRDRRTGAEFSIDHALVRAFHDVAETDPVDPAPYRSPV